MESISTDRGSRYLTRDCHVCEPVAEVGDDLSDEEPAQLSVRPQQFEGAEAALGFRHVVSIAGGRRCTRVSGDPQWPRGR